MPLPQINVRNVESLSSRKKMIPCEHGMDHEIDMRLSLSLLLVTGDGRPNSK